MAPSPSTSRPREAQGRPGHAPPPSPHRQSPDIDERVGRSQLSNVVLDASYRPAIGKSTLFHRNFAAELSQMEQFLLPDLRGVLSRPRERHLVCIDDGVYASGLLLELPENDVAAPVVFRRRLDMPRSAGSCSIGGRGIPVGSRTRLGEADTAGGIRFRRNRISKKLVLLR